MSTSLTRQADLADQRSLRHWSVAGGAMLCMIAASVPLSGASVDFIDGTDRSHRSNKNPDP